MIPGTPQSSDAVAMLFEGLVETSVFPYLLQRWLMEHMEDDHLREESSQFAEEDRPQVIPTTLRFRRMVSWLLDRITVDRDTYYDDLDAAARITHWTVSGGFDEDVLDGIKHHLATAIEHGQTFESWKASIDTVMNDVGVGALRPWHAEVVFRNAWQNANQAAKWKEINKPGLEGFISHLRYHTIGDDRVRPTHEAMNNFTAPVDDPIWNTWRPPNGHNCRCTVIPITTRDAARRGIQSSPPVPDTIKDEDGNVIPMEPDRGWDAAPAPLAVN